LDEDDAPKAEPQQEEDDASHPASSVAPMEAHVA